jgi:hypothetical protein
MNEFAMDGRSEFAVTAKDISWYEDITILANAPWLNEILNGARVIG